ncbi:MAG: type II secretion system protein N [Gammaproteobacteria bacterium]
MQNTWTATGVIRLRDLHTTFGRTLRFGDFTAQLQAPAQGQGVVGSISDDGGPLMMHGDLTLAPDGGYRFSGEFGVRDASDSQLKPILVGLLGAPEPDGKWRITFSGRLTK